VALPFAVWGYWRWHAFPAVFDDAYISFRYADNLVRGDGLVFNRGERVEGYTNFLWVLVSAAAIRVGLNPLGAAVALGVTAYLGCIVCSVLLALRADVRVGASGVFGLPLVALLVLVPGFASFSGTGLETSFVALLVLLIGVLLHLAPPSAAARVVGAGLSLTLVLTRLDTALAIVASAAAMFAAGWREGQSPARCARDVLRAHGATAAGTALYLAWKKAYYGDILPNTYYAKAADGVHLDAGIAYVTSFVQSYPSTLVLVLLLGAATFMARGPAFSFLLYGSLGVALHIAYVLKVGGDFMEYRFMWEVWPLLVGGAIVGAGLIAVRARAVSALGAVLAVAGAGTPTLLEKKFGMQSLPQMDSYARLGERVGSALGRALPAGTVVSTTLAGTGYFMPGVTTIDQWGLNDRFVAHTKLHRFIEIEGFNARGHLKYAPLDYLRSRGVNLYMEHPMVCECDRPCREGKPDVFVRLDGGQECVRTWYLTPTEDLTRLFCSRPDLFVLDGVPCPGKT
jgi:arabinofuranosyltransferase